MATAALPAPTEARFGICQVCASVQVVALMYLFSGSKAPA
jgi:hypothetical protein